MSPDWKTGLVLGANSGRDSSTLSVFDRTTDERMADGGVGLWPRMKARVSHRLAMHLSAHSVRAENEQPIVSFTFDDVPRSAATTGAAILDEFEAHGTFYIAGSLIAARSTLWDHVSPAEIVALHRRGHEIGCHTFSHKKAFELDTARLTLEIKRNLQHLQTVEPDICLENFAYPYGVGAYPLKRTLMGHFSSSRSIMPGINSGRIDLQFLRANPLVDAYTDRDGIERLMDQAKAVNGWLIFYSHDVAAEPSEFGCSPRLLEYALQAARRRQMRVANIFDALRELGV